MKLTVELFGLARHLSKEKEVIVEVSDDATLRDVVAALAERFPSFLGPLVVPETYDLVEPYFFNIDGRRVARSLDIKPKEDEHLLLMFVTAGG